MLIELKGNNYYSRVLKRANNKLQNSMFWVVITWCVKFRTRCEISFTHTCSLSCSYWSSSWFHIAMQNCWLLDFFSDSLPCILDWLGKGLWSSKAWILHVIELQLAFPWTTQSSPSFLACFNDKKATKNTKTCQKLISNTCKGP